LAEDPAPTAESPAGIPGSELRGPFPVGRYAAFLRDELRKRARVQLFGEVWNLGGSRAKVYFELRDATGAIPCSMWRNDFEALGVGAEALADGAQVVVAGGPDFYPGSRTSSPSFSFSVADLRVAGEGDLLAQLARLRKQLDAEGLFEPQKRLPRPALPRAIGVVTGERGKARDDVVAGLRRRGWAGRVVWAFAPVQDRHAAPRIAQAVQDLAACGAVDVIVVARGGGSLADLFAFCDETLCRTVAMLPVPVIASVGHHTDRTLIDDVAAVSCSTPTHAAESAVPLHCDEARASLRTCATTLSRRGRRTLESRTDARVWAASLSRYGRRAVVDRARELTALSRAPAEHLARHRVRLHQQLREMRASARRRVAERAELAQTHALVVARKGRSTAAAARGARARSLETLALALAAHDPDRTLARGYALVSDARGDLLTTAGEAATAGDIGLRFADGSVRARVEDGIEGSAGLAPDPPGVAPDPPAEPGDRGPVRSPGEDSAP
jgi:exodeoxyribonuclease VII large subunit